MINFRLAVGQKRYAGHFMDGTAGNIDPYDLRCLPIFACNTPLEFSNDYTLYFCKEIELDNIILLLSLTLLVLIALNELAAPPLTTTAQPYLAFSTPMAFKIRQQ